MQELTKRIIILVIGLFSLNTSVFAQAQLGNISGVVRDAATAQPVSGATVALPASAKVTTSNAEGAFLFTGIPVGQHDIRISFVGYNQTTISGVMVESESETSLNIDIAQKGEDIEEVVITAARSRSSEIALLAEQQRSTMTVQKIGAQELSRRGVSDAASAVTKMSGVSKSDGTNQVYVRGLGDRYNATSLNGLPLPSNDPEKKNILLEIF
ncbi:MAG TPA: TonB-dependent receptor, partial [Sphingobacteriaceae bacterium]|nr:TonB-dependent receptor [Sphingobacteriaceae bacterium]